MRTWGRMAPFARIAFVPVVALLANFAASKHGTNAPPQMMAHPGASAPQLAMPANAVRAENWWRRGAWEDVRRVEFT